MPDAAPSRPNATIVIAAYNGRRYLYDCLRSVLDQLGPGDELIVVDNASTDDGPDLVREHYPGARLVRNAENQGFAAACNQGARLATGQVLVFLNQDTRVQHGWLEGLVRGLEGGDGVGLTTSRALMMSDPGRIHLCGQDVHYTGLVFGRGFSAPAASLDGAGPVGAVAGCSFAVQRELWEALGGFDEALYMYYEETDLSWRARLRGHRSFYVADSVLYHDYRPAAPTPFRFYHSARNRRIMLLKNWRWPTLILVAPALVVAELVEWGQAVRQGRAGLGAKLRADLWILRHLGLLRRLHTAAQQGRSASDAQILAERLAVLSPQEMELGAVGNACIRICNALLRLNHPLAHWVCERMGW